MVCFLAFVLGVVAYCVLFFWLGLADDDLVGE